MTEVEIHQRQLHRSTRFFEMSIDVMVTVSLDGFFSEVNPAMPAVLGWTEAELKGVPFISFVHPDDQDATAAEAARLFEGPNITVNFQNRYRAKDGSFHWMLWSARHDEADSLLYAVGKDVTQRHLDEEAIRMSEVRLRHMVEANVIGIILADTSGRIVEANGAFCAMLGWTQQEVLAGAVRWDELTPPEWAAGDEAAIESLMTKGLFTGLEKEYYTRSGGRIPVLIGATLIDDTSGLCVCFVLDLSDRKRAENEIRELNTQLEQRVQERTAELEAFTYSVSHDLRAPLRAISGFALLLRDQIEDGVTDRHRHYMDRIANNAERMGKLIDDLLAFSQLGRQGIELSSVEPRRIIETILDELAPDMAGRDIAIVIGDLPSCRADRALLAVVFQNLLANAIKFTSTNPSARIEISGWSAAEGVTFSIIDDGVGFDPTYGDKIFQVFQRLHRADEFEGTGVGLAIVDRIVRRHGGTVRARSTPGAGATFEFTLPGGPNV